MKKNLAMCGLLAIVFAVALCNPGEIFGDGAAQYDAPMVMAAALDVGNDPPTVDHAYATPPPMASDSQHLSDSRHTAATPAMRAVTPAHIDPGRLNRERWLI